MRARLLAGAVVLSALTVACNAPPPAFNAPSTPVAQELPSPAVPEVKEEKLRPLVTPEDGVVPLPDPDKQDGHVGRAPRRLTVDQLGASIKIATGRDWANLPARAQSLGKADYAQVNTESTEPNLVFAKFLEDGAREVCVQTAKDDLLKPQADRILAHELGDLTDLTALADDDINRNLVRVSKRFWGVPLEGAELDRWRSFTKQMAVKAQTAGKYQLLAATCIALMTDPRFFSY